MRFMQMMDDEASMQQAVRQQAAAADFQQRTMAEAVQERRLGLPTLSPETGLLRPALSESDRLEQARVEAGTQQIVADVRRNLELGVFTPEEAEAALQSQYNELTRGNIRASGQGPLGVPLGPLGADVPTDAGFFESFRQAIVPQFKTPSEEQLGVLGPAAGPVSRELTAVSTPLGGSAFAAMPLTLGPRLGLAEIGAGSLGATGLGTIGEAAGVPEEAQIGLEVGGGFTPVGVLAAGARRLPGRTVRVAEEAAEAAPDAIEGMRRAVGAEPFPSASEDLIPVRTTLDPSAPPPSGSQLRPFDEVVSEVQTSDNPIVRAIAGKTGINPSVLQDTPTGKGLVAYYRQRIAGEQLTDLTVSTALDTHAQAFTGRRSTFVIGQGGAERGAVRNVQGVGEGQSRLWQDVFSRRDDYNLTPAQRAYVDDFLAAVDEVEALRIEAGLKPRPTRSEDGWFYVPRQVKEVRGVELRRPSNPGLQRHYDEAAEGVAAGIRYDTDPRATLELHVRQAYKEIADAQLSDYLEPLSITAKQLIPEPVLQRMSDAVLARRAAERELRALRAQRLRLQTGGKFRGEEARAQQTLRTAKAPERQGVQQAIRAAEARLDEVMKQYNVAKNRYSKALQSAQQREVAPGSLFGMAEENIPIAPMRYAKALPPSLSLRNRGGSRLAR
jgi:hypothetical protein